MTAPSTRPAATAHRPGLALRSTTPRPSATMPTTPMAEVCPLSFSAEPNHCAHHLQTSTWTHGHTAPSMLFVRQTTTPTRHWSLIPHPVGRPTLPPTTHQSATHYPPTQSHTHLPACLCSGGINASLLPQQKAGSSCLPLYPHQYFKVNNVFEVRSAARRRPDACPACTYCRQGSVPADHGPWPGSTMALIPQPCAPLILTCSKATHSHATLGSNHAGLLTLPSFCRSSSSICMAPTRPSRTRPRVMSSSRWAGSHAGTSVLTGSTVCTRLPSCTRGRGGVRELAPMG